MTDLSNPDHLPHELEPTGAVQCNHEWDKIHIDGCHYYTWDYTCRKCGKHEHTYGERNPESPYAEMMMRPDDCDVCYRLVNGIGPDEQQLFEATL